MNDQVDLLSRITSNPRQCGGRPCIRGMRIRVKDVLDMLAGGATEAEILADYPYSNLMTFARASSTQPPKSITPWSQPRSRSDSDSQKSRSKNYRTGLQLPCYAKCRDHLSTDHSSAAAGRANKACPDHHAACSKRLATAVSVRLSNDNFR